MEGGVGDPFGDSQEVHVEHSRDSNQVEVLSKYKHASLPSQPTCPEYEMRHVRRMRSVYRPMGFICNDAKARKHHFQKQLISSVIRISFCKHGNELPLSTKLVNFLNY
jgi:hypothetical protein